MDTFVHYLLVVYIVSCVIVAIERAVTLYHIRKNKDVFSMSWFWKDTIIYYVLAPFVAGSILAALLAMWDEWYQGFLERHRIDDID